MRLATRPIVHRYRRCAGCEAELCRLDARLRRCDEHGQAVAIVGDPGCGKSRLIEEWLRRHPEARALRTSFSLFGGQLEDLVARMVELPAEGADGALVEAMVAGAGRAGARVGWYRWAQRPR
jgi:hypothetical protein